MLANHPRILLLVCCLLLYLPGIATLPPLDRDESRYAQASKQMLESRDYVNISFQDEPRHKKPVGIYWLQSTSAAMLDPANIASYRLVSVIGAIAAVLLFYGVLVSVTTKHIAWLSSGLLAASLGLVMEAHQAKTDAVLLLFIIAMQGALLHVYLDWQSGKPPTSRWIAYGFWGALGVGVLIKGPVAPLIAGLTGLTLALTHRRIGWVKRLHPFTGPLLALAIILPWLLAIQQETGGRFVAEGYLADILPKLLKGVESHGAPPGYYLGFALLWFWPATLLLPTAIPAVWKARREPLITFALAWLIPTWVVFELIPTKLPNYMLPAYPALAMLVAYGWHNREARRLWLERAGLLLWAIIPLLLCAAMIVIPLHLASSLALLSYVVIACILLLLCAVILRTLFRDRMVIAGLAQVLLLAYIFGSFLPSQDNIWISKQLEKQVMQAGGGVVALSGYHEPSAVFLLGTHTLLTNPEGVASHLLHGGKEAIGVVTREEVPALRTLLGSNANQLMSIGEVTGLNYSKGKPVTLHLYRLSPALAVP